MEIKKIDFESSDFKKVMKDSPKELILFNEKADYYCCLEGGKIVSICGIIKYRKGYRIVTLFTYKEFRKTGIMTNLIMHIMNEYVSDNYYANANENSYKIFESLGFEHKSSKKFKNFTRKVMVFEKENYELQKRSC